VGLKDKEVKGKLNNPVNNKNIVCLFHKLKKNTIENLNELLP